MRRLARAPALHFLLLGGLLLGLREWWDRRHPAAAPVGEIVVSAADMQRLRAEWADDHGAAPGPAALQELVDTVVDDEILHREALALGLDRGDATVRERLVRLGGFLGEDQARDAAALEREARRLGLAESNVVIRRHLVQMMRLAVGRLGGADMPSEAELQAYLDDHAREFAEPARIRLTHVYLGRDGHGAALEGDAQRLLAELRKTAADPATAGARGDAFIHGATIGPASPAELERLFGPGFAPALEDAPVGAWVGPVPSGYGLHLVWVHERTAGKVPALAAVRRQVLHRWLAEHGQQRARERLLAMRARYRIEVESP